MASRQPATGGREKTARSSTELLASSSAEQPARNDAGEPVDSSSSAEQPASNDAQERDKLGSPSACRTEGEPNLFLVCTPNKQTEQQPAKIRHAFSDCTNKLNK